MKANIGKKYAELGVALDNLEKVVRETTVAQQVFRPDAESWSILQIIEHLLLSESGLNVFFRKYPPMESNTKLTFRHRLNGLMLLVSLKSPVRFRAPKVVGSPGGKESLSHYLKTWKQEREILKAVLMNISDEKAANYTVFKHPVAGKLSLWGTLAFSVEHIKRHTRQIKGLMKYPAYPKG